MKIMRYIMLVIALAMFTAPVIAAPSVGNVIRSISSITVASGATVTLTMTPANLPTGAYYTYETIPAGLTFVSTTANSYSNDGNNYTLKQNGATAFTYIIKASASTGTYTFSGTFKDIDLNTGTVMGSSTVMVGAISQGTVTRSLSASTVAPDGIVTITITPDANLPSGSYYTYETIPAGFKFVNTTAFGYSNVGNVYTLKQSGPTSFRYTIKAPAATGTYAISGTFKDIDLNIGTVMGSTAVSVGTFSVDTYLPPSGTPAERKEGLIRAMDDYFDNGVLTKPELLSVLDAYFA